MCCAGRAAHSPPMRQRRHGLTAATVAPCDKSSARSTRHRRSGGTRRRTRRPPVSRVEFSRGKSYANSRISLDCLSPDSPCAIAGVRHAYQTTVSTTDHRIQPFRERLLDPQPQRLVVHIDQRADRRGAAYGDSYSSRCSRARRTAFSRTSGG